MKKEDVLLVPSGEVVSVDSEFMAHYNNKSYSLQYAMFMVDDKYKDDITKVVNKEDELDHSFISSIKLIANGTYTSVNYDYFKKYEKINYDTYTIVMRILLENQTKTSKGGLVSNKLNLVISKLINIFSHKWPDYYKKYYNWK